MRRGNRRRIGASARTACAACLLGTLAACSSGGHKTTASTASSTSSTSTTTTIPPTTTLPTQASITTVKNWFAAHGQPVIAFERVTDPLATGELPSKAACLHFLRVDLPRITNDQNKLVALAEQIPNAVLASAVANDMKQKLLVGRGCGEAAEQGRTIPAGVPGAYASVKAYSEGAHLWLRRFGITV